MTDAQVFHTHRWRCRRSRGALVYSVLLLYSSFVSYHGFGMGPKMGICLLGVRDSGHHRIIVTPITFPIFALSVKSRAAVPSATLEWLSKSKYLSVYGWAHPMFISVLICTEVMWVSVKRLILVRVSGLVQAACGVFSDLS